MSETLTNEKIINLEMQLILNRRLYEKGVIDRATYENVTNELLKLLQKIKPSRKEEF
jgi:hypothetical protein